jgi:hypothetical protein
LHQADALRTAAEEAAAAAEAERLQQEVLEQQIEEMNDRCASPESAFGPHIVRVQTDTFVWGTLTCCWNCEEPMLVWDARRPAFKKKWARIPGPAIKAEVRDTRIEDQAEVHRAVDDWIVAAQFDIPKAVIKLRRSKAAGRIYPAFVCPGCDNTMGQFFISRIRPEKWSIISGPNLETRQPQPVPRQRGAAATSTLGRCRAHATPRQWCDWCQKRPAPRLGNPFFKRQ